MSVPISKTALLLHLDSNFADSSESPKTVTAYGNAQIGTTDPKLGGGSLVLDGVSSYVDILAHSDLRIGTRKFTVEFFIKTTQDVTGYLSAPRIFCDKESTNISGEFKLWLVTSVSYGLVVNGIALALDSGAGYTVSTTTAVNDGIWHHIAFCRSDSIFYVFVDGVLQSTAQPANIDYFRGGLYGYRLGARSDLNSMTFVNAQIDEFCMTVGACKYTETFTPPTAPLTAETYYAEATLNITAQNVGAMGAIGVPPVDLSNVEHIDTGGIGVLELGFPASESAKLYDKIARTADATPEPFFDQIGYGTIIGTIKEKSTPTNIPRKCRVYLYRHPDNRLVRSVWSDDDGNYEFRGVNPTHKYMVLATDPQGLYRAVVADNLTPDAIPQPA